MMAVKKAAEGRLLVTRARLGALTGLMELEVPRQYSVIQMFR